MLDIMSKVGSAGWISSSASAGAGKNSFLSSLQHNTLYLRMHA